jgi:hypothetical protein
MEYKLLAVDLDGTLLPPSHEVTPQVQKMLLVLKEKGVKVAIATGRMFQSAVHVAYELGIDVPLITYNGALIKCAISKEVYDHKLISKDYCQEIVAFAREHDVEIYLYLNDQLYVERETPNSKRYGYLTKVEVNVVDDLTALLEEDPTMLMLMGKEEKLLELQEHLQEEYSGSLYITKSFPTFLEIMNPGVSKAEGLKTLAARLGINPEEIIAIGDNYNDLEMIKFAGLGVAVNNAPEGVKAQADYVAKGNYDDGVIEVVNKFILKG